MQKHAVPCLDAPTQSLTLSLPSSSMKYGGTYWHFQTPAGPLFLPRLSGLKPQLLASNYTAAPFRFSPRSPTFRFWLFLVQSNVLGPVFSTCWMRGSSSGEAKPKSTAYKSFIESLFYGATTTGVASQYSVLFPRRNTSISDGGSQTRYLTIWLPHTYDQQALNRKLPGCF